jgi:hypothetical protein
MKGSPLLASSANRSLHCVNSSALAVASKTGAVLRVTEPIRAL